MKLNNNYDFDIAETLVDLLRQRTAQFPDTQIFRFLADGENIESSITYSELDQKARAIGARLQKMNLKGERALLLFPPGLEYIVNFFGCLYAGVIAVPAYPPRLNKPMPRLRSIAIDSQATVGLTTKAILNNLEKRVDFESLLKEYDWIATKNIPIEEYTDWEDIQIPPDYLAFLQYTSGSTSSPKGVMLSHENLIHNLRVIHHGFQMNTSDTGIHWLPSYHDMGLIGGILGAIFGNAPTILMSPFSFIQKPFRWLNAISKYQGKISGGPNFAYQLCVDKITPEQRETLDLSSWRVAFTGAEPVRQDTLKAFEHTFAPHGFNPEAFYPCYGLAEATLLVSGGSGPGNIKTKKVDKKSLQINLAKVVSHDKSGAQELVSSGKGLFEQEVVVVNRESFDQLPDGEVGEIWVSGPSVAKGYWNRAQETETTFNAYTNKSIDQPFLRTGDLGFISDGELYITGRLKDLIIIRGRNHYPQDIEATVEQAHPALAKDSGAAFSVEDDGEEKLVIVQEVKREHRNSLIGEDVAEAVRQAVVHSHEIQLTALILIKPLSIPKTSSGKIQRHLSKSQYLANELKVIATWHASDDIKTETKVPPDIQTTAQSTYKSHQAKKVEAWLAAHIADVLNLNPEKVDIRIPFEDYGLDSLRAVSLAGELESYLNRSLSPTLAWDYPTIEILSDYLANGIQPNTTETHSISNTAFSEPVAVVGMGCRFPGADNPESYWELLLEGRDAITNVPVERWDSEDYYDVEPNAEGKMVTRWGGFLNNVDQFDPAFFGISPREASRMDPQQRILLEVAWETFENAGIIPSTLAGSQTGVYIGITSSDYANFQFQVPAMIDAYAGSGNAHSIAANRLSYFFDLKGPSMAVDTACSSSLVSLHLACQSLRSGEVDLALAGGVNLILAPELTITFSQARMMSPEGRCKTFDASADGYVRGEGCGLVLLKRYSEAVRDGDHILGLIKGSAVNQDGRSNGLTAPNGPSQQAVIQRAIRAAGIKPAEIDYIEAHGTGTPLGDPIEIESLQAVFDNQDSKSPKLTIGSVKTNIGHLEGAAGIAGFMKVLLSFQHEMIPAHINLTKINPYISLDQSRLKIATKQLPWERGRRSRLAGVSSFGFGGTNAHVILEEGPITEPLASPEESTIERPLHLFSLSAKTESSLKYAAHQYIDHLEHFHEDALANVAYSANTKRSHFSKRLAISATSIKALQNELSVFARGEATHNIYKGHAISNRQPKTAFLFTGQGSQYVNMGQQLYKSNPLFRSILDECNRILLPLLEQPLLSVLYPDSEEITLVHETAYAQPALFALEYALVKTWESWGIKPDLLIGHSLGEYVAACYAGVFSLQDGLKLVAERGRLMQSLPQNGTMAAVFATEEIVEHALAHFSTEVSIAAINGPENITISGSQDAVKAVVAVLQESDHTVKYLAVSHAFHSPLMDPILDIFEKFSTHIDFQPLQIPLVSTVTGEILEVGTRLEASYWRKNLRQAVKFAQGINTLVEEGCELFLEMGPKPTLISMGRGIVAPLEALWLPSLDDKKTNWETMLESLGVCYANGSEIDWVGFDSGYQRQTISLPTYQFERQRYWIESPPNGTGPHLTADAENGIDQLLGQLLDTEKVIFEAHLNQQILARFLPSNNNGRPTFPSAVLVEMVTNAPVKAGLGMDYQLEEVSFQTTWNPADTGQITLRTILTQLSFGDLYFEILSKSEDNQEWQLHASGKLSRQADHTISTNDEPGQLENTPEVQEIKTIKQQILESTQVNQLTAASIYLQEQSAKVLQIEPSALTSEDNLQGLGLDSLMAMELKLNIEKDLGIVLPVVNLLNGPTIKQLSIQVLEIMKNSSDKVTLPMVVGTEELGEHPLSHGQLSMWFAHQLVPEKIAFNPAGAVKIKGNLDVTILHQALTALVDRHPMLRTTFQVKEGQPIQTVHQHIDPSFLEVDATDWSDNELKAQLEQDAYQPFDMEKGPLLRMVIYERDVAEHFVVMAVHHIVSDFWSLTIIVNELLDLYQSMKNGNSDLPNELSFKFTDYVKWEKDMLASGEADDALEYWSGQFGDELPILNIATDRPRPSAQTYTGGKLHINLEPKLFKALLELSKENGATLYMTLFAAFQVLLHRYSRQEEIMVASPLAGRNLPGLENLVGYFVNPIGMLADFSKNPTFLEFLAQVRGKALGALSHQNYPLELLAQRLDLNRDPGRVHLFQTMFIYQKAQMEDPHGLNAFALGIEGAQLSLDNLTIESIQLDSLPAQFDLTMMVTEIGDEFVALMHYNADLFIGDTIQQLLDHFKSLLNGIIANPEQPVASLPMWNADSRDKLLHQWNQTEREFPSNLLVQQLFDKQATDKPQAVAVEFEREEITYKQLEQQSNQIAHYLQELGIGTNDLVGIYMERSAKMIAGLLGVLKAGAAYVPLDPVYPQARINYMIEDAQLKTILTENSLSPDVEHNEVKLVNLDSEWESILQQSKGKPKSRTTPYDLMYVIYTSGSTGKPKGVEVPHRAVVNFLHAMCSQPGMNENDSLLAVTTLSFDIAVLELFLPLSVGAKLILASREVASDGMQLAKTLQDVDATIMQATPSTWLMLLESGWEGKENLKILCGGEKLHRILADKLISRCESLWNMYGPTETTVWSTIYQVQPGEDSVSIGKPIANTQIYLLDSNHEPVPVGVHGDVYIGGDGISRGYLNRPELTTSRFVPDPFHNGSDGRLYNTGDSARYLPDGNIDFLGRNDLQVKIRGHRIELGEVEAALLSHPRVRESAVVAKVSQAEHYLVAYWVSQNHDQSTKIEELRKFLGESLPKYMIPSHIIELIEMPLTPNGKLNRRALPDPSKVRPELYIEYTPPRTEQERILTELVSRVLSIERVGVNDNFFDLGGNSLKATRLIFQVNEKYEINLPLLRLFENPTVTGLSMAIDDHGSSQSKNSNLIVSMTMEELLKEAVIDETIRANGKVFQPIQTPEYIFLTGATGFLGAYLLQGLLETTTAKIYCHVRASDMDAAMIRLKNNMIYYQLWNDEFIDRIIPILGDLTQRNLGIKTEVMDEIAAKIDIIYHNGAIVNFAYPYQALKAANVYSTREILHLASREMIKPVHFISSISVLFDGDLQAGSTYFENVPLDDLNVPFGGYGQSKWVSEKMMFEANQRGIPISIYRPDNISGDSQSGIWNNDNLAHSLLKASLLLGSVPDIEISLGVVPVDFIRDAILHLSKNSDSHGKVFHLSSLNQVSLTKIAEILSSFGYAIDPIPLKEWKERLYQIAIKYPNESYHAFYQLIEHIGTDRIEQINMPIMDLQNTLSGLKGSEIINPSIDHDLLARYIQHISLEKR